MRRALVGAAGEQFQHTAAGLQRRPGNARGLCTRAGRAPRTLDRTLPGVRAAPRWPACARPTLPRRPIERPTPPARRVSARQACSSAVSASIGRSRVSIPWLPTSSTSGPKPNRSRSPSDRPETTATCDLIDRGEAADRLADPVEQDGVVGVVDDRSQHAVDVEADEERSGQRGDESGECLTDRRRSARLVATGRCRRAGRRWS